MSFRLMHRVPTPEAWRQYAEALAAEVGGLPMHYANRTTACGRRVSTQGVRETTTPGRVTCKNCLRSDKWRAEVPA